MILDSERAAGALFLMHAGVGGVAYFSVSVYQIPVDRRVYREY